MEIINVKVERQTKEKIERLVKTKKYKNKSDALRQMINEHFEEHPELFESENIEEATKEADQMSEAEFDRQARKVFMNHKKSAAELVAEDRER